MSTGNVEIRSIDTTEGFEACADLQQAIWDFEDREIVPVNELTAIHGSGGLVLGAWETKHEEDELVGFLFGMLGKRNGELIHVSRMMGVIPEYRESNVAYRLKCRQRQYALEQNLNKATWTFDPLLSVNAYFNIEKLGADVDTYKESVYGNSTSWMNQGWDTDRFVLVWALDSEKVRSRVDDGNVPERDVNEVIEGDEYTFINNVEFDYNQIPHPEGANLDYRRGNLLVEIPRNISFIKSQDLDLAREWRQHTRKVFNEYFRRDYRVKAFVSGKVENPRFYRSLYILDR